jgi:hypothetical protein
MNSAEVQDDVSFQISQSGHDVTKSGNAAADVSIDGMTFQIRI